MNKLILFFLTVALCIFIVDSEACGNENVQGKDEHIQFNLDKIRMNVIKTADNGVVNSETIFHFSQKEGRIFAEYSGGKISQGFLVGSFLSENKIQFSYCQMQNDGTLDNGISVCELSKNKEGKIQLTEYFEWKSRPGEIGTNIFQEI